MCMFDKYSLNFIEKKHKLLNLVFANSLTTDFNVFSSSISMKVSRETSFLIHHPSLYYLPSSCSSVGNKLYKIHTQIHNLSHFDSAITSGSQWCAIECLAPCFKLYHTEKHL